MADTELVLLSERVGQLLEETKSLKAQNAELAREVTHQKSMRYVRTVVACTVLAPVMAGGLSTVGYPIYKGLTTPDTVTHCYVETKTIQSGLPPYYDLIGSIPWHNDRAMGSHPTLDIALAVAAKMNCPIK